MTNEEYLKAVEERLDKYSIEETIERLQKNKEKSITLKEWLECSTSSENHYQPSDEEIQRACEDAEQMMENMRLYGTIDKPLD